jgi:hypothetical protein
MVPRVAGMMEGQLPIAVVGLVAIGMILAVNFFARPPLAGLGATAPDADCAECGTVVAVRRSAHSVPVTFVEIRMADGSVRTLRAAGGQFNVGDAVEVRDGALAPHGK